MEPGQFGPSGDHLPRRDTVPTDTKINSELAAGLLLRGDLIASHLQRRLSQVCGGKDVTKEYCFHFLNQSIRKLVAGQGIGQAQVSAERAETMADLRLGIAAAACLRLVMMEEAAHLLNRKIQGDEIAALSMAVSAAGADAVFAIVESMDRKARIEADVHTLQLSLLGHQLHGNLNGVLMMLEVLKQDIAGNHPPSDTVADLNVLRREILATLECLDTLVPYGNLRRRPLERVDLREMAEELARHFLSAGDARRRVIDVDGPFGVTVESDRALLTVALLQLIQHFVQRADGGRVHVNVRRTDQHAQVEIADDGPALTQNELAFLTLPNQPGKREDYSHLGIAQQAAEWIHARLGTETAAGAPCRCILEIPANPPSPTPPDSSSRARS